MIRGEGTNQTTKQESIYSLWEAAKLLKVSSEYVSKELREKRMTGYKRARRWYVFHSDLVEWIKAGE